MTPPGIILSPIRSQEYFKAETKHTFQDEISRVAKGIGVGQGTNPLTLLGFRGSKFDVLWVIEINLVRIHKLITF